MRKETVYLFVVISVVVIGGAIFFINGNYFLEAKKEERQENIANCLVLNNVKLYVSSDCEFCKQQKEIFGGYFNKIKHIECGENGKWADNCTKKKIHSVPMWTFPSNTAFAKRNLISCIDCKKRTGGIKCEEHCYTESEDGRLFRVSGFLDLKEIDKAFECSSE